MYFSSTELLIDAVEPYHPPQAMQTVSFPPHVPAVEDAGALGCAGAAARAAEPSQPCRFKISGGFLWLLLQSMRVKFWQCGDCSLLDLGELKEKHAKTFLMLINPPRMCLPYWCFHMAVAWAGSQKYEGRWSEARLHPPAWRGCGRLRAQLSPGPVFSLFAMGLDISWPWCFQHWHFSWESLLGLCRWRCRLVLLPCLSSSTYLTL